MDKLIRIATKQGEQKGKRNGLRIGRIEGSAIGLVGASAIYVIIRLIKKHFKRKKEESQNDLEKLKSELIQGIKEYDATHQESPETTSC